MTRLTGGVDVGEGALKVNLVDVLRSNVEHLGDKVIRGERP